MIGGAIVNLIKDIRLAANMSQEDFASALGTTPVSINRWENAKTEPTKIAQKQLYQFCLEHNINVADMIVKGKEHKHDDDRLILYHGSRNGLVGDIAPKSREICDFGKGFYMGTAPLQPLTLVCSENKPVFYTVEFDLTGLKVLNVDIGLDWALLIAYYRKEMESVIGSEIYNKYAKFADGYDVIVGYIANDRMFTELSKFFNRTLTDIALIKCLSALDLGLQYVAITEKACKQIKVIKEENISSFELAALVDMSTARRKEGIALAEEIEVQYRREGKFFDEILRGE